MVDSRAVVWVWEACMEAVCKEAACREAAKLVNITNIMVACKVEACKVEACKVEACRYVPVFLRIPDRNNASHVLASFNCTMPCSYLASNVFLIECSLNLHAM